MTGKDRKQSLLYLTNRTNHGLAILFMELLTQYFGENKWQHSTASEALGLPKAAYYQPTLPSSPPAAYKQYTLLDICW